MTLSAGQGKRHVPRPSAHRRGRQQYRSTDCVHAVFLDGVFHEGPRGEVRFHGLPRLETEDVARVLEDAARRITRHLWRRGLFADAPDEDPSALTAPEGDERLALAELAEMAASG